MYAVEVVSLAEYIPKEKKLCCKHDVKFHSYFRDISRQVEHRKSDILKLITQLRTVPNRSEQQF